MKYTLEASMSEMEHPWHCAVIMPSLWHSASLSGFFFYTSGWEWYYKSTCGACGHYVMGGGCVPYQVWPLTVPQVFWWVCHEVKGEALAINEAENTSGMVWLPGREEGQQQWEGCKFLRRWSCFTQAGSEVSSHVCGCGRIFVNIWSTFWYSAFSWGLFWTSSELLVARIWLSKVVLEAQNGAGVGVVWPLPSGLASGILLGALLLALAATPLGHKQLNEHGYTLHLTDLFDVV